jgi:hypothetical protein
MPLAAIGLGVGLISGIGKLFSSGSANSKLDALISQDPAYKPNPIAAQRLGLAQSLLNARMPGAATAEKNIYNTQANTLAADQRAATSSAQLLGAAGGVQGQTQQAFSNLGEKEAQDYQRRYANLEGAQEGQISEEQKAYQDKIRKFQDIAQIRGAQNANRQAAWGSLSNLGFGLANFGLAGGTKALFGSGGGGQPSLGSNGDVSYSGSGYGGWTPDSTF